MAEVAIEDSLFEFLEPVVEAAQEDDEHPLYGVALQDTVYQVMPDEVSHFIQIGNCDADFSPSSGGEEIIEFDGDVVLVILSRVDADDYAQRKAARTKVVAIAKFVAKLFIDDPTAGDRLNDVRVLRCLRDWTSVNGQPYALVNVPLIVNETGGQ